MTARSPTTTGGQARARRCLQPDRPRPCDYGKGEYDAAIRDYARVAALAPDDPWRTRTWRWRGSTTATDVS